MTLVESIWQFLSTPANVKRKVKEKSYELIEKKHFFMNEFPERNEIDI